MNFRYALVLALANVVASPFGPSSLAQNEPDRVKRFFLDLTATPRPTDPAELAEYRKHWERYVGRNLADPASLYRAGLADTPLVVAYPEVFAIVYRRLRSSLAAVETRPAKLGAAGIIGEMARSASHQYRAMAKTNLWPVLHRLARDDDRDVRLAALRAIARSTPSSLDRLAKSSDPTVRKAAILELQRVEKSRGPAVRSTLLLPIAEAIESHDPELRRQAARSLQGLAESMSRFLEQQIAAVRNLGNLGNAAEDAADIALGNRDVITVAGKAIQQGDSVVVGHALDALAEASVLVQRTPNQIAATAAIWTTIIRSDAFTRALSSNDPRVRLIARRILEHLAQADKNRRGRLPRPSARTEMPGIKTFAIATVLNWSTVQRQGQPPRQAATEKLRGALLKTAQHVATTLDDPVVAVRIAGIDFLEEMAAEPLGMKVVEALTARVEDTDPFVRWAAARTLGKLGLYRLPGAGDFTEQDRDGLIAAIKGLARLIDPLHERDPDVRKYAAQSLGEIALGAKSAKKPRRKLLALIARYCAEPLVAAATDAIIDPPFPAWSRSRPYVFRDIEPRTSAFEALQIVLGGDVGTDIPEIKQAAAAATKAITRQLVDPDVRIRSAAATTLGAFGSPAADAIPALEKLLDDPSSEVRRAASVALLRIRPK